MQSTTEASSSSSPDDDLETYLLLLLSDSNLPTGGFVASSGLESFHAHGLLHNSRPTPSLTRSSIPASRNVAPSQAQLSSATLSFAQSTLHSYARSSFPFLARVHTLVQSYLGRAGVEKEAQMAECLEAIASLDDGYHSLLLNHVARRASKAQGIALLTLYSKAFARPIGLDRQPFSGSPSSLQHPADEAKFEAAARLVDKFKLDIRRSTRQVHGHLPICWAVFAACLGIGLKKAVYLHLFLQARSLFSSSIRLNTLGPYLAHQVMRFQMRGVVEGVMREMEREGCLDVGAAETTEKSDKRKVGQDAKVKEDEMQIDNDDNKREPTVIEPYSIGEASSSPICTTATTLSRTKGKPFRTTPTMQSSTSALRPRIQAIRARKGQLIPVDDDDPNQGWAWDWPEEQDVLSTHIHKKASDSEKGFWTHPSAPATTFPLGEIVQARHDQLHSRLFNS
ncbi:Urease accessory protein UreF [Kalmanozyma brasiliensis GHG001]|uniref:Urease accessory protein UreF n=1 Tax=Kalmanozyma brasiliensis (strain GHG001) TaxID=1365824 RepID=UPI002867F883|nr:Urease accessory protein UreF [Kalmanozyma brasiliensis GHG001]KAF6767349.1 Urease accessory protein UreF [Kalmanozyma brasiliensis GHG001]